MVCTEIKIENHDCNKTYEFQICESCGELVRNHDGRVIWNFIAAYGLEIKRKENNSEG